MVCIRDVCISDVCIRDVCISDVCISDACISDVCYFITVHEVVGENSGMNPGPPYPWDLKKVKLTTYIYI